MWLYKCFLTVANNNNNKSNNSSRVWCIIMLSTTQLYIVIPLFFQYVSSLGNLADPNILVLIITQKNKVHEQKAQSLRTDLISTQKFVDVLVDTKDFHDVIGGWAVWPIIASLISSRASKPNPDWLLVIEDDTVVNAVNLVSLLSTFDASHSLYIGHGLKDQHTTVIHHYAYVQHDNPFLYPDFAAGVVFSWPAVVKLNQRISENANKDFTIDAKHELAMLLWENGQGIKLTHSDSFCLLESTGSCVTQYKPALYESCSRKLTADDVLFAVKTFTDHHKNRIVVVKRTWAREALNIEYYSDSIDNYIPTIDLGIKNTERGHCGKTMAIIKRFAEHQLWQNKAWLVIADDDTLISVPRLLQLLSCYDAEDNIILGERYAYGLQMNGRGGYEYPTGGSGMIFSRLAALELWKNCECPSVDSPDDMIIGMCARGLHIPVLHSPALHQARPPDYSEDYLKRIKPISFHKHWEIDPYQVYTKWLHTQDHADKVKQEL